MEPQEQNHDAPGQEDHGQGADHSQDTHADQAPENVGSPAPEAPAPGAVDSHQHPVGVAGAAPDPKNNNPGVAYTDDPVEQANYKATVAEHKEEDPKPAVNPVEAHKAAILASASASAQLDEALVHRLGELFHALVVRVETGAGDLISDIEDLL